VVRLEEIVMIHDLRRQGLSVSAIARKTGLDRKTVRKQLVEGIKPPTYKARPERPRQLAAFAHHGHRASPHQDRNGEPNLCFRRLAWLEVSCPRMMQKPACAVGSDSEISAP